MDFVFDPSLVLYLPLYQLDGASFVSKDAYGHLCTVTGALWRPNGKYFDGSDDLILIPDADELDGMSSCTIAAWANPNTVANWEGLVTKRTDNANMAWNLLVKANNTLYFSVIDAGGIERGVTTSSITIPLGQFTFVVGTWDGTILQVYANSVVDPTTDTCASMKSTTADVRVGKTQFAAGLAFDGIIGEVYIYNRALTPQEILHNYLAIKWRYR